MLLPFTGVSRRFFALIIGVEKYKFPLWLNLEGCVADADDIVAYVTRYLGVSDDHISVLNNEMATRANIIHHIQVLATDGRIAPNDPILIYYAGAVSIVQAPTPARTGWTDAPTSLLHPYDFNPNPTTLSDNPSGISDKMLNGLLANLATAKGNNIVRPSLACALCMTSKHLLQDRNL